MRALTRKLKSIADALTRYTVHGRGAKTLRLSNLPLTTTPNLLDSSTSLSTDAIHVSYMFFKSLTKVPKSGSKTERFANDNTLWPFFFNFFKIWFSKPHCPQRCVHPSYATRKKWLFSERTNEHRTDGRNICFWLADGRKERFAQLKSGRHQLISAFWKTRDQTRF